MQIRNTVNRANNYNLTAHVGSAGVVVLYGAPRLEIFMWKKKKHWISADKIYDFTVP